VFCLVVDDLGVDVVFRAEHKQAAPCRRAVTVATQATVTLLGLLFAWKEDMTD